MIYKYSKPISLDQLNHKLFYIALIIYINYNIFNYEVAKIHSIIKNLSVLLG